MLYCDCGNISKQDFYLERQENGGLVLNGYRVSDEDDEKVLELDGRDTTELYTLKCFTVKFCYVN